MNRQIIGLLLVFVTVTGQKDICLESSCDNCIQSGKSCETCSYKRSALECNGKGDLICGVCRCDDGYGGSTCQIHDTEKRSTHPCIQPNTSDVCSRRGECILGKCKCDSRLSYSTQRYTGQWCQCDDYSCRYYSGQLCGGPDRGFCDCGVCNCRPGYSGYGCSCSTSNASCIAANGMICNGHGRCTCGKCKCDKQSNMTGPTCEECRFCPMACRKVRDCVQCMAFQQGPYSDEETCSKMCYARYQDSLDVVHQLQSELHICEFKGDDDCVYTFGLSYDEGDNLRIKVTERSPKCDDYIYSSSAADKFTNYLITLAVMLTAIYIR